MFVNEAQSFLNKAGKWLKYLSYFFGAILIIIGILIFTSQLSTATGGTNNATLQYLFNTYDSEQLVTTGTCSAGARFLCVWPARVHRPDATNNE